MVQTGTELRDISASLKCLGISKGLQEAQLSWRGEEGGKVFHVDFNILLIEELQVHMQIIILHRRLDMWMPRGQNFMVTSSWKADKIALENR